MGNNVFTGKRRRKYSAGKILPAVLAILTLCIPLAGCGSSPDTVISEGESLVIDTADVTEDASFYTVEVDGTEMEVLAIRTADGEIRTAFNTCQVCYSSGQGYYVQEGDYLVCQNCGNRYSAEEVEIETGGCNPWPITDDDKTVTDDTIEISYDFLNESKAIFATWKSD